MDIFTFRNPSDDGVNNVENTGPLTTDDVIKDTFTTNCQTLEKWQNFYINFGTWGRSPFFTCVGVEKSFFFFSLLTEVLRIVTLTSSVGCPINKDKILTSIIKRKSRVTALVEVPGKYRPYKRRIPVTLCTLFDTKEERSFGTQFRNEGRVLGSFSVLDMWDHVVKGT